MVISSWNKAVTKSLRKKESRRRKAKIYTNQYQPSISKIALFRTASTGGSFTDGADESAYSIDSDDVEFIPNVPKSIEPKKTVT